MKNVKQNTNSFNRQINTKLNVKHNQILFLLKQNTILLITNSFKIKNTIVNLNAVISEIPVAYFVGDNHRPTFFKEFINVIQHNQLIRFKIVVKPRVCVQRTNDIATLRQILISK